MNAYGAIFKDWRDGKVMRMEVPKFGGNASLAFIDILDIKEFEHIHSCSEESYWHCIGEKVNETLFGKK